MTLRIFLQDIVFECADSVVQAVSQVEILHKQVICNKQSFQAGPGPPESRQSKKKRVNGVEGKHEVENPFFGTSPRALQPLLKQQRRRHEVKLTPSSPSTSILLQVKAIRQKLNGACGYYSLFHSSMVREQRVVSIFRRRVADENRESPFWRESACLKKMPSKSSR